MLTRSRDNHFRPADTKIGSLLLYTCIPEGALVHWLVDAILNLGQYLFFLCLDLKQYNFIRITMEQKLVLKVFIDVSFKVQFNKNIINNNVKNNV